MEEVKPTLRDLRDVVEQTLRRRGLEGQALKTRVNALMSHYLKRATKQKSQSSVELKRSEKPRWMKRSDKRWKDLVAPTHSTCLVLEMVEIARCDSMPKAFPYICAAASAFQAHAQHKWVGERNKLSAKQEFAEYMRFMTEANPRLVRDECESDAQLTGVVEGLEYCVPIPLEWSEGNPRSLPFKQVEAAVRRRLDHLVEAWKQLRKSLPELAEDDDEGRKCIVDVLEVALDGIAHLPEEGKELHGALARLFTAIDDALKPFGQHEQKRALERCNGKVERLQEELERVTGTDVARRTMEWLLLHAVGALTLEMELAAKSPVRDLDAQQRREIAVCVINCDQALHAHRECDPSLVRKGNSRKVQSLNELRQQRNVIELHVSNLWIHAGSVFCEAGNSRKLLVQLVNRLRSDALRSSSSLSRRLSEIGRSKKGANARAWRAIDSSVNGYREVLQLVVASLKAFCSDDESEVIYRELMGEASKEVVRKVRELPPVRKVEKPVVGTQGPKKQQRKKGKPIRHKTGRAKQVVLPAKVQQIHRVGQVLLKGPSHLKTMLSKLEARLIVPQPPSIDGHLEMLDLLRRTLEAALEAQSHELGPRIQELRDQAEYQGVVEEHGAVLDRLASAYRALYYPSHYKGASKELLNFIERCEAGEDVSRELESEYVVPVLEFVEKFVGLERPKFGRLEEKVLEGKRVPKVEVVAYKKKKQKWDGPTAHEGLAETIKRLRLRLDSALVMPVCGKASAGRLRRRDGLLRHVLRSLERIVDKLAVDPMLDLNSSCLDLMNMAERAAREVTVAAIEHWDESGLLDDLVSEKFPRPLRYCNDVPLLHAHLKELAGKWAPKACPSWLKGAHHKLHYSSDDPIQKLANQMVKVRRANVKGALGPWVPNGIQLVTFKSNAAQVIQNTRENQVLPALEYVMEILDRCFVVEGE